MTSEVLHWDWETRSVLDLTAIGVHLYAQHKHTSAWLGAYAFGEEEPELWTPGEPCPDRVVRHIKAGGVIRAYNSQFERVLWRDNIGPRLGWPVPALEQFECVMARAFAHSLPGSLDQAAAAVGLDIRKDDSGRRLMLQMCRPRRMEGDTPIWWDEPDKLRRLGEYCKQDVRVERDLCKRLLHLAPSEKKVFLLDQRINDLGVYLDRKLCQKALKLVDSAQDRLNDNIRRASGGDVSSVNNAAQIKAFLRSNGVDAESIAKAELEELLVRDDLPAVCRNVLEIRQEGSKASVAKIAVMLDRSEGDGFMRGNLQYHGAGTGRWAARGKAQLQNLKKPEVLASDDDAEAVRLQSEAIADIMRVKSDSALEMLYGPALTVLADTIRGMIIAPPGQNLYAADFSAIEAREVAWLAGQTDVLDVFARGEDIYCHTATGIYGRPITKSNKAERSVGKVAVLALGFGGGVGAFQKFAKTYRVDMAPVFPSLCEIASAEVLEKAQRAYDSKKDHLGMSREAWLASDITKLLWRQANPKIVSFWYALENAAIEAIENPGEITYAGEHIAFRKSGSWLFCRLPSGRVITYPYPKVAQKPLPWDKSKTKKAVVYKGVHPKIKKWMELDAWYGLLCENVTQATARDVMAEAMLRVEDAGYRVCITIHDEVVAYALKGFGSIEQFMALMATVPGWNRGCPIAVEGWVGSRYRK